MIWIHMFHAMVRFTLILICSCGCLQEGLIISGMLVQERAVPKHRSPTYQIIKVTNTNHMSVMKISLTIIPMCPRERFPSYKSLYRLVLRYKNDWATLLHLFFLLLLVTRYKLPYHKTICYR